MKSSVPYFDKIADSYFRVYEEESPGGRAMRVRKSIVLGLFNKPGGRVLDVGCGPGVLAREMLDWGCEFWGVDGSFRMIEQCRLGFGRCERARFVVGDATALPFPDEYFDAVICLGVIDHVEKSELAVKEMLRLLRKGGTLIVSVPYRWSPYAVWRNFLFNPVVALLRPIYYGVRGKRQKPALASLARLFGEKEFTKFILLNRGHIAGVVYFNFNLLPSPLDEWFPRVAMWIADRVEGLRHSRLRWLGAAFVVKAEKVE